MEAKQSELTKLNLSTLKAETLKKLIKSLEDQIASETDPDRIDALTIALNNVKNSFS